MEVKSLNQTPLQTIVTCLIESFADYFVSMPDDPQYWKTRWKGARVDYRASYGMFDDSSLVGFMVHGIDYSHDKFTAFNTGTGVIPSHRGQRIVQKMYEMAVPQLKNKGIQRCALEVIQNNEKAIKAYRRVGFEIFRELKCFKGSIKQSEQDDIILQQKKLQFFDWKKYEGHSFYSWDHVPTALLLQKNNYSLYLVFKGEQEIGYFIINPNTGYLAQFDISDRQKEKHWPILFEGISQITTHLRIINIDKKEKCKVQLLLDLGLENYIDQYEMELMLEDN